MRRSFLMLAAGLVGCSPQSPPAAPDISAAVVAAPPAPAPPPPAVVAVAPPAVPVAAPVVAPPVAQPAPPPPAVPVFAFPADLSGKELPRVVTPAAPAAPPVAKFGTAPAARTVPARLMNPDPLAKVVYAPPPLLPPKPAGLAPVALSERVPLDLGAGAAAVPARPALPDAPVVTAAARDVNLPPTLAPLARLVPDRAGLDDPTAEPGNATIVTRSPTVSLLQAGFQKVALPDPFELGEQVKPRITPAAEPGLSPVPVNPQRPK